MYEEPFVDARRITLERPGYFSGLWVTGRVNGFPGYTFHAKVFDVGSVHGIRGGRVSKLQVFHHDHRVMNYDRGWDAEPRTREQRRVLRIIMGGFPNRELNEEQAAERDWQRKCRRVARRMLRDAEQEREL